MEDTHDGEFLMARAGGGGAEPPNAGPVKIGLIRYEMSGRSIAVRAAEGIVRRSADLGLPAAPAGFRGGKTPALRVGDRVVPKLWRPKWR